MPKSRYIRTPSGAYRDKQTGRFVSEEVWRRERERLRRQETRTKPKTKTGAKLGTKPKIIEALDRPGRRTPRIEVMPEVPLRRAPGGRLETRPALEPTTPKRPKRGPRPAPTLKAPKGKYVRTPEGYRERGTGRFVSKKTWEKERRRLRKPTPAPPGIPEVPGVPGVPEVPGIPPELPEVPEEVIAPPEEMEWPEEYPEVFEVDDEVYKG